MEALSGKEKKIFSKYFEDNNQFNIWVDTIQGDPKIMKQAFEWVKSHTNQTKSLSEFCHWLEENAAEEFRTYATEKLGIDNTKLNKIDWAKAFDWLQADIYEKIMGQPE